MVAIGLSPLARGTHSIRSKLAVDNRFIPAGAGNTGAAVDAFGSQAVSPRWRGEHSNKHVTDFINRGLSPLARGTRYRI